MMADARPPVMKSRISLDTIHDARQAVEGVEVDRPLLESIAKIRRRLGAEGLSLSDRRYKESLSIVRSKAWLNVRTYVIEDYLAVLANILWDDPVNELLVRGFGLDLAIPQDHWARWFGAALQLDLTYLQASD